jgi:hypothetical protein
VGDRCAAADCLDQAASQNTVTENGSSDNQFGLTGMAPGTRPNSPIEIL